MPAILSTSLLDDRIINNARSKQVEIDAMPFINLSAIMDRDLRQEIAGLGKKRITAVFTSANAVKMITDVVTGMQPDWAVYCIGNATREAVLNIVSVNSIKGMADNAATLAEVIKRDNVHEVTFFCGDKRLGILPAALRETGCQVHELVVYKTEETPAVITKRYDGVLFFSPSAVASFFSANRVGQEVILFAIGDTSAKAIKERVDNKVVVCSNVSKERVVNEAIQFFNNRP